MATKHRLSWPHVLLALLLFGSVARANPASATHTSCNGIPVPHTYLGGSGDDFISAGPTDNAIDGQGGADLVEGQGGDDTVCGRAGRDRVIEAADDGTGQEYILLGDDCDGAGPWDGADFIDGGDGNDSYFTAWGGCATGQWGVGPGLFGEGGNDDLVGGKGNDFLSGGDGASDHGDCGTGADDAFAFPSTEVAISCEHQI